MADERPTGAVPSTGIEIEVLDPFDLRTAGLALRDLGGEVHPDRMAVRVPSDGTVTSLRAVVTRLDHVGLVDARVELGVRTGPALLTRLLVRLRRHWRRRFDEV
jgi:hypothetical protein